MTPIVDPKRVLYVENGIGYGGAIICLRHLIRHLDRHQYLPMVITGRKGSQYREIADEALWKYIPDRLIDVVSLQKTLSSKTWIYKVPGLHFISQQIIARLDDLFNFLPFFIQLLWTAWQFKTDLIHANNEPLCNRAALMVAKCLQIPCICHVRGNQTGSYLMRWSYSLPDHFISVSNWIAENIKLKLNIPNKNISVIYDGIALDNLNLYADSQELRAQHNLNPNDFVVGLVGLLIPWKGQDLFIDAAKLLKEHIPNLKMLIIGGTPDDCIAFEQHLKSRVEVENLQDIVIFTGHIAGMEAAYNTLNIVVSASTSPEPLGTVVIECMAMGKLLLGPNHGGTAEMITHDETGLLFDPNSAESLAENIMKIFHDPSLAIRLGKSARAEAIKKFDVHQHAAQVMNIYKIILDNHPHEPKPPQIQTK